MFFGPPEVPAEILFQEDPHGVTVHLRAQVHAHGVGVTVVKADGTRRRGREPFVEDHGLNVLVAAWDGAATLYLPHGMTVGSAASDRLIVTWFREDGEAVGQTAFEGLPLASRAWDPIELFRSLVHLAMDVARAGGGPTSEAVRCIRERVGPTTDKARDALKSMMKERPATTLPTRVAAVSIQLPGLDVADLLGFLIGVAAAPAPHPERVDIVGRIAAELGVPEEAWRGLASELGVDLGGTAAQRAEALEVLGLAAEASAEDAKQAYRRLMRENHPDRHASHGPEVVAEATRRTVQIQKAYEALKSTFEAGGATPAPETTPAPDSPPEPKRRTRDRPPPRSRSPRADKKGPTPLRPGRTGRALEDLAPFGAARFRGHPAVQVCTEDDGFVAEGSRVEIVAIHGDLVQVRHAPLPARDAPAMGRGPAAGPPGGFDTDEAMETSRSVGALIGIVIGFTLGLGAGGIGAIPGAVVGGLVGWFWAEIGAGCLVVLVVVAMIALAIACALGAI